MKVIIIFIIGILFLSTFIEAGIILSKYHDGTKDAVFISPSGVIASPKGRSVLSGLRFQQYMKLASDFLNLYRLYPLFDPATKPNSIVYVLIDTDLGSKAIAWEKGTENDNQSLLFAESIFDN